MNIAFLISLIAVIAVGMSIYYLYKAVQEADLVLFDRKSISYKQSLKKQPGQ